MPKAALATGYARAVRWWLNVFLMASSLGMVAGCGDRADTPAADNDAPYTDVVLEPGPESTLYEQMRAGGVQLQIAMTALADAFRDLEEAIDSPDVDPDIVEGLIDARDYLDDAGAILGDHAGSPPSIAQIQGDFSTYDERRLDAIAAINEARFSLLEASGIIGSLIDALPEIVRATVESAHRRVDEAVVAAETAIEALGGTVEAGP